MALNKKYYDALVVIETNHPGAMDDFRACDSVELQALGVGYNAYVVESALPPEQQALVEQMENLIKATKVVGMSTTALERRVTEIQGNPTSRAKEAQKAHIAASRNGHTFSTPRTTKSLVGRVTSLPFKSDGEFYRFVSVSPSEWYLWAMNNGTRQVYLAVSSKDVADYADGLADGVSANVSAPTRARKVARVWVKGYNGNEPHTVGAVVAGFNQRWRDVNAGGVGYTQELEIPAGTWLNLAQETKKVARSKEVSTEITK